MPTDLIHTLTIAGSVLSGFAAAITAVWKLVTNHIWHMKKDIIDNSDSNRLKVVTAINDSNKDNVQAIELAARDIVIAVLKAK